MLDGAGGAEEEEQEDLEVISTVDLIQDLEVILIQGSN
jgi:hypothetical protein